MATSCAISFLFTKNVRVGMGPYPFYIWEDSDTLGGFGSGRDGGQNLCKMSVLRNIHEGLYLRYQC
jgi:hypothetical protein